MAGTHAEDLAKFHALVGEISTYWNDVDVLWYLIFTTLLPDTKREHINAIFHQFETGKRQRELIIAVADVSYPPDALGRPHPLRKKIGQLNARTNNLSGMRNSAIHAEISFGVQTVMVATGSNPFRKNKLAGTDLLPSLNSILNDVKLLALDLKRHLLDTTPKLEVPQELIEAHQKLGLLAPEWWVVRSPPKSDPEASP